MSPSYYLVAVDSPLPESLTYLPPVDGARLARGQAVTVPLGRRTVNGVIIGETDQAPEAYRDKLKPIAGPADERPAIPAAYMSWLEWLAQYYVHPLGLVAEMVYPPLTQKTARKTRKGAVVKEFSERSTPPPLTDEQRSVLASIQKVDGFNVNLLFGVTGSGKTEVYLNLLERTIARGKQALVLVPEISLTPQLIDRFSRRFPEQVAVLHSHLTPREKTNQWWSMVNGERQILIGARSALFCPLPKLDVIVLDEEHEPSYKQDEQLRYHARDAAIMLARNLNIPIVLGSATPSLESWNNARAGKYRLHRMTERVNARAMPTIEIVDLREEHRKRKETPCALPFWLSERLHEELVHVLDKGEQAALFLNRRGVAQTAQCHACGYSAECPNCSVTLTVHAHSHLVCHYCDYSERLTELCPDCKMSPLEPLGLGTERVENDIKSLFPNARVARADRDEVQSRDQLEQLISDVEERRTDILVGTQMIAKGLDFPHLNLVGLVLADVGFHWPDFRASERSFQLLTQVSGRSGRQSAGRVVIQTYDPDHMSIRFTLAADFTGFAEAELDERAGLFYPPIWRMAMIRIQSRDKYEGERVADRLVERAQRLRTAMKGYGDGIHVLGPAEAPLFKLRNKFRFQILIKGDQPQRLNAFCRQLLGDGKGLEGGTKVQVDIDPFQML